LNKNGICYAYYSGSYKTQLNNLSKLLGSKGKTTFLLPEIITEFKKLYVTKRLFWKGAEDGAV
jgi:hypothetical protein